MAVVLEQHVAAADGRDVEVGVAVVVDVGKRRGHADLVRHRHAGRGGDVLELAAAGVLPELIAADLVDEVDVGEAVAVDVGDREAVAVIVVRRLVGLSGVVDDAVLEGDAALGEPVRELEVVKRGDALNGLDLRVPKLCEPRRVLQIVRDEADRGVARRELCGRSRGFVRRAGRKRRRRGDTNDAHDEQHRGGSGGRGSSHVMTSARPGPACRQMRPPEERRMVDAVIGPILQIVSNRPVRLRKPEATFGFQPPLLPRPTRQPCVPSKELISSIPAVTEE